MFSYVDSKGPISRQMLCSKCPVPQPTEAPSELSAPGSQQVQGTSEQLGGTSLHALVEGNLYYPWQATFLDSGALQYV